MSRITSTYLLDLRGLGEVHVVDRLDDVLGGEAVAAEEATIEALDGFDAGLDTIELDVNLAGVVVEGKVDVNDFAPLLLAFGLDVRFEFLLPVWVRLPVSRCKHTTIRSSIPMKANLLVLVVRIADDHATSRGWLDDRRLPLLRSLRGIFLLWLVDASELAHQHVAAVVGEVDACDVGVVQSARTASLVRVALRLLVVAGSASVSSSATHAGEGRSLALLLIGLLQDGLRGLVSEFVAAQSDTDGTSSQLEAVHHAQSLLGLFLSGKS